MLIDNHLKILKLEICKQSDSKTDLITKTTILGIFDFRALRDEDFLLTAFQKENYRKEFTDALKNYLSIFNEKAKEYRKI